MLLLTRNRPRYCPPLHRFCSLKDKDLIVNLSSRSTILIVTHNLAQSPCIADDTALFWVQNASGRLIETGPAKQLFGEPRDPLTAAYVSGMRG